MNSGKMVFSQIMDYLPWWRFHSIVKQYRGNHKVKFFSCAEHFRIMAFAQFTHRKSLRDVEAAFNAIGKKAYHMGIKCKVARSTLSDANEQRNWQIYADFAQVLIDQARTLYAMNLLMFNGMARFMRLMQQPLIFAYLFFHGQNFEAQKPLSNCTRKSIYAAIYRSLSIFPMASSTM